MKTLSDQDAPFTLKIVDKRGQPKPEREATPPDFISDIKPTDDPLVWIAVLPGNRIQEQQFKVSRLEARGFNLAARRAKGLGPDGQRAVHACRQKVLKVMEAAMRVHNETAGKQPTVGGIH